MDTKISPDFWDDEKVDAVGSDLKLAALWLLTNRRIKPFGYAEANERRFAVETGLPAECYGRALEALPETFQKMPKGYFIPNFIRRQIGSGPALLRNNMVKAVVASIRELNEPELARLVMQHYPELKAMLSEALPEGFQSAPGAQEQSRAEQSRAEQSRVVGGAGGRRAGKQDPAPLGDQPFAPFGQRLAKVMGRRATTPWQPRELEALRTLHRAGWGDQADDLTALEAYYAAKIPSDQDFRRRDLATLLNNFGGEVDRARKYVAESRRRQNPDGLAEA